MSNHIKNTLIAVVATSMLIFASCSEPNPEAGDADSLEIFAFPPDADLTGHSIRDVGGRWSFWDAECASELKHNGCHWFAETELETFEMEWIAPDRLLCRVSLEQWDFDGLSELLIGAAAAPFLIRRSAQFTDRYPDDLWITSTEVRGLERVSLEPGS